MTAEPTRSTPVIAGFYPDPSICRVGEDYYLVASSFEYFPGIPIWKSTNLVAWDQVGNVLDRPSQLPLPPLDLSTWGIAPAAAPGMTPVLPSGAASTGTFAPTIRHHAGLFWMTTTNFADLIRGPFVVHAEHAEGPWSEPVFVEGLVGIDPDLAWDGDDVCHMTVSAQMSAEYIVSAPIDPMTGALLGAPAPLWQGTGGHAPEAPHLYRRNDWWYLLLAEGGTERGHSVIVARAREIAGPWESCPANPILTHRGLAHPVQSTGHGDLVEMPDGQWAMVYLAVRPRGFTPNYHVNGRETFLAGVDWVDDWPVVVEDRFDVPAVDHSFVDRFDRGVLDPRWVAPGHDPRPYLTFGPDGVTISAGDRPDDPMHLVATRVRDEQWTAEADLDLSQGDASLVVRLDVAHQAEIRVQDGRAQCLLTIGPAERRRETRIEATAPSVTLFVRSVAATGSILGGGPDDLELGFVGPDGPVVVDRFDGRYLSTEVAGGFTGRVVGIRSIAGAVRLREFRYRRTSDGDRGPLPRP